MASCARAALKKTTALANRIRKPNPQYQQLSGSLIKNG
jgi:hypothetical protein